MDLIHGGGPWNRVHVLFSSRHLTLTVAPNLRHLEVLMKNTRVTEVI